MKRTSVLSIGLAGVLALLYVGAENGQTVATETTATEAPAGFDGLTNGAETQAEFDLDRERFEEQESLDEGLGPVYNAQSCGECHQSPVTGGISQVTELRAGHLENGVFIEHPGGSLINDRAVDASIQEHVLYGNGVTTLRTSLNVLGDGYIEAIADNTIRSIAEKQPAQSGGRIAGEVIMVPVLEADGVTRVARFGWKNQHASLLSFSADAYLNEMGVTSSLQPAENTSLGRSVADYDTVPDPEDEDNVDVESFTRFMRATKVPPRDETLAATAEAKAGSALFNEIGCSICHTRRIVTAPPNTSLNGGKFVVPPALGNKILHPFSDFLLHDIDTGDGIVQNGGPGTANKMRTPPLWGVRTRSRLMHDGESLTFRNAILRHRGEALDVTYRFLALAAREERELLAFLGSL